MSGERRFKSITTALTAALWLVALLFFGCSDDDNPTEPEPQEPLCPVCPKPAWTKTDDHTPQSQVADWGTPVRIGSPINTPCPEDAIEISADGQTLYYMFTEDLLDSLTPAQILARENNTYRAERIGDPGEFDTAVYYDLARGTSLSLDGELSFASDGSKVYFHSNRPSNTGYLQNPQVIDIIDIYVADIVNGVPGPGVNLGSPPNSVYADGEHCIHPDDTTLYFASHRPNPHGGADIWSSVFSGGAWSEPVNLGNVINSPADDIQPTFTQDGDTMYFASDRNILVGMAIYRSVRSGSDWSSPALVMRGIVGEPSLTADGRYLYFVHVLTEGGKKYDADIWYSERTSSR
jgi:Tol biopolymer transport system component